MVCKLLNLHAIFYTLEQIGMPSHSDNSIIMGNSGNGYARITLVSIDE